MLPSLDVPFGEEHHDVALRQPPGNLVGVGARRVAALAVDEDGALRPGEKTDDRPARHFLLGDERDGRNARQDRNVQPRRMVGEKQQRAPGRRFAGDGDAHAHENAHETLPELRDAHRGAAADCDRCKVDRQENEQRESGESNGPREAEGADHQVFLSSGTA